MATASVSSLGVGSNLDLAGILDKLMAAEQQPMTKLTAKIASTNTKITTFGLLQSKLSTLQSSADKLSSAYNLNAQSASSGDEKIATATAAFNASAGNYSLSVSQLASAQKSFSNAFSSSTSFGQGSLTFTFGDGTTQSVDLSDQSSYTLSDLRGKINDANIGVTATIVNGSDGQRLILTGNETGANAGFTLSATNGTTGGSSQNLSAVASFDTTTSGLARSSAQDAQFTLDGVAATSSTNSVSEAITGLSINLVATGATTLTVANDSTAITKAVQSFVDDYNAYVSLVKENSSYDSTTKKADPLNGESAIRSVQTALTKARTTVPGELSSATFKTLGSLGISVGDDGTLSLDESKLSTALATSSTEVVKTLNAYGTAFSDTLSGIVDSSGVVGKRIDSLNHLIDVYNDNKDTLQVRLDNIEKRYKAQFTALDTLMSSLNTTSSYLTQQLAALSSG